nr:hypothetical protein [Bradyrhizobium frederickii]
MGFAALYPSYSADSSCRTAIAFVHPVNGHEEMVMMERRNGIHADAGFGQT